MITEDLSGAPKHKELPEKTIRISPNIVIDMGCRVNEADGSSYPAITWCKYKRNSFCTEKNCFKGKPLEISFGMRTAQIGVSAIQNYLDEFNTI
jgi:hypothetical protein